MDTNRVTTLLPMWQKENEFDRFGYSFTIRKMWVADWNLDHKIIAYGDYSNSTTLGSFYSRLDIQGLMQILPFVIIDNGFDIEKGTSNAFCAAKIDDKVLIVKVKQLSDNVKIAVQISDNNKLDVQQLVYSGVSNLVYVTAKTTSEVGTIDYYL